MRRMFRVSFLAFLRLCSYVSFFVFSSACRGFWISIDLCFHAATHLTATNPSTTQRINSTMRLACFVFAALMMATNADVTDYNDETFATGKVFHGECLKLTERYDISIEIGL